ncbi:MAG: response regulator [Sulfuricurvum sp.]|uniref:response regulator n=1 Tax=Sulfuricurvum sp. TaxID=2025608 RepID=UPI0025FE6497|nr:response regulator [Sulfuricurvum sp.]MBV5320353.1 response regulator [Sulfuricurvum sp.]
MRTILIVDDDKNNRTAIKLNIIKNPDIAIFEAENGKKALEICASERVDIIFMDIMMPVMDGIEATTLIKKDFPNIMIIAISAMDDDYHKSMMLKAGAEDYISKPFHPDVLKKRLVNYLRLIVSRSSQDVHLSKINLFKESVYDRRVSFKIVKEPSLALFWEEYLLSERYSDMPLLCDGVRSLYDVGLELLNTGSRFNIHCEENESNLFFTLESSHILELDEVNAILDREFSQGEYLISNNLISCRICIEEKQNGALDDSSVSVQEIAVSKDYTTIINHTSHHKMSAAEYIRGFEDDLSDRREEFEKAYDELDSFIYNISKNNDYTQLHLIGEIIVGLSHQIERLFEFHLLAQSVFLLGEAFIELEIESIDDHLRKLIIELLNGFLTDFDCWIKEIFIDMSAKDIHYLDNSLISCFAQITSLIKQNKEVEDEVELFLF